MSLLKTRIHSFLDQSDIEREKSQEELELEQHFGHLELDVVTKITIANDYMLWKQIIDTDQELTIFDFLHEVFGHKKFERKNPFTSEFMRKCLESTRNEIRLPKTKIK